MGAFNLLPFFFLCFFLIVIQHYPLKPALAANIDAGENSTHTPPPLPPPSPTAARSRITPFKPSIAIVVGILTTIFSVTFLLLLYAKHCKRSTYIAGNSRGYNYPLSRGNSGINRKIIESLPMFRFSSLRGQKEGLECAVCLNKFEADEVLRLLPKCKHAFHVECVDTWLDAHSTCPLCRHRVDPEDVLLVDHHDGGGSRSLDNHNRSGQFTPRNSDDGKGKEHVKSRISGRHSSAGERRSSLEIIVENPGGRISLDSWSSRRKTGNPELENREPILKSLTKKSGNCKHEKGGPMSENPLDSWKAFRKDGQLMVQGDKHRLEHRIIISSSGMAEEEKQQRRRWSDVQAAEFLYLRSEMILVKEGCGRGVINERSMSEITGMSRYRSNNGKEGSERQEEGL